VIKLLLTEDIRILCEITTFSTPCLVRDAAFKFVLKEDQNI